jgi:4-diphosphocytidyl-2-C-methyl-D-erythritol kinase
MLVRHAPLTTRAPAKINLTLHVLGRREDGYHELESLVAFAGAGDTLTLRPDEPLGLEVMGPLGSRVGPSPDNLVLKAARELARRRSRLRLGTFHLVKRLPVAAGIGGGSSDAAAALRLLGRLNRLRLDDADVFDAARATGADVPVCLDPRARMMRGMGETLGPSLELPRVFAVLVNPGVPVATEAVFQMLGLRPGESVPSVAHPAVASGCAGDNLLEILRQARNDLEPPACEVAPAIGEALAALGAAPGCRLARMSGSGSTVFGLFDDGAAAAHAAGALRRAQPGWWVKATSLR